MSFRGFHTSILIVAALTPAAYSQTAAQPAAKTLSLAEKEEFLKTARILSSKVLGTGVTKSSRATLSRGTLIHDAQVQGINMQLNDLYAPDGKPVSWRDDYRYNIAAYKLDRLLNMNMIPPSVERVIAGKGAAVTWWSDDIAMMESDRVKKEIDPPDSEAWKRQLATATLFDQLIFNVDRNTGNLLITKDWKLVLIDHTRAFAPNPRLLDRENFDRCSKALLDSIRSLNAAQLNAEMKGYLTPTQVDGLLFRRDLIVKHFDRLIAEKGEAAVLFP
jgi:hypothetical protein